MPGEASSSSGIGGRRGQGGHPLAASPTRLPRSSGTVAAMSLDAIRAAYEALGTGDVEPLVALMDPDLDWRGVGHGWRFWRPVPS